MSKPSNIDKLLALMAALRDPVTGCPWDVEQDFKSIAPYAIEEAYEVADTIEREDFAGLKEELGDLLLQVIFHARMAKERNIFSFDDIVETLCAKLVSRHPHVFGDEKAADADDVSRIWETRKKAEKSITSAIDGVTLGLPALLRAQKLQKKAAKTGFVWPDLNSAWAKCEEELSEFKMANTKEDQAEELGDLLFCIVNYARLAGHDAEDVLAKANRKFEQRFQAMEKILESKNQTLTALPLDHMLDAWNAAKTQSK